MGDLLDVDGHEGQIGRQLVAALALLDGWAERHLRVVNLVGFATLPCPTLAGTTLGIILTIAHQGLDGTSVARGTLLLGLGIHNVCRAIVLVADDHDIGHQHGNLKSVLVFNKNDVLALETTHGTSASLVQEPNFIAFLHIDYKVTKNRVQNKRNSFLFLPRCNNFATILSFLLHKYVNYPQINPRIGIRDYSNVRMKISLLELVAYTQKSNTLFASSQLKETAQLRPTCLDADDRHLPVNVQTVLAEVFLVICVVINLFAA